MGRFIYEQAGWPQFFWNSEQLLVSLAEVRHQQGLILGKMMAVGFDLQAEANLEVLTKEVLTSSEIEGEILPTDQVRSSIARRLGMEVAGMVPSNRAVDGVVDMMVDAVNKAHEALTEERLFAWHASLFPGGRSGMYQILAGQWRADSTGPMQVVSGPYGRERVHFQAPPASQIPAEMTAFLLWFNQDKSLDPIIKAGVAHLWFLTIHPFEDGNGRIGRAISDLLLARADGVSQRYYSLSAQIQAERNAYYEILEDSQKGTLDITDWLVWFLAAVHQALTHSHELLDQVLQKHTFLQKISNIPLTPRQQSMLHRLLGDFKGKLTTAKWAKMAKCSHDTALRDIQDLIHKHILKPTGEKGRSTAYELDQ
ncbi:MAG: Fic family protein [Bacteroidota bacterium]